MWTLLATIFGFISMAATLSSKGCIHYDDDCREKTHTLNCNVGVIRVRSVNVEIGAVIGQVQSESCDCKIDTDTCEVDLTDEDRFCYGKKQCEISLRNDMLRTNIEDECRQISHNNRLVFFTIEYTCYLPPGGQTDNNDGDTNTSPIVIAAAVSALVVIAIVVIVLVIVILYKRIKKRKHARHETVARYHSNRGVEGDYNTIPADHDDGSRYEYATLDVDGRFGASGRYDFAKEDGGYDKVKPDNHIDQEKNGAKSDSNGYGRINNDTYDKIRHNKPPNTRPNVVQDDYSHLSEQSDDYSHLGDKPVNFHNTGNDYNRLHEPVKPPAHSYDDAISSVSTKSNDKTEVNVDDIVIKRTGSYEEPTTLASDKHVNTTEHENDIDMGNVDRTRRGSYEEPTAVGSDKQFDNTKDNADTTGNIDRNRKGSYEEPSTEMLEKQFDNSKDNVRKGGNISDNVNIEQINQDGVQLPTKGGGSDDSSSSDDDF
ncbi:hypothetical protein ACF0H5_007455 [Mactra antiquata]